MRAKYLVTAVHPTDSKYGCEDREFVVSQDGAGYYASAYGYGCSKTYGTPHVAITEMLYDHGCKVVRITKVG